MPRFIHRDVRDALPAFAGIRSNEQATVYPLARAVENYVKGLGLAGIDLTVDAERLALATAVGTSDVDLLTKAINVVRESGRLVPGF